MRRARLPLLAFAVVLALVLAGCSGSGPQSGSAHPGQLAGSDSGQSGGLGGSNKHGGKTTTTSFGQSQRKRNLADYMQGIPNRTTSGNGATYNGPAANFASFMSDAELWGAATATQVGNHWEICGTQLLASCLNLTDFTYDTNGSVQSFSADGQPLDSLLQWQPTADLTTGDLASVGLKGALAQPASNRVAVLLSYGWLSDVSPNTTGCDPSKATYDVGGGTLPATGSGGGGPSADGSASFFDSLVMYADFSTSSLGGTVNVSCYSRDGSSETFHISVPG